MPRPTAEHYELSDTEKRDLIKLIEAGRPLPEKYRFLLFADKREVELVWNGKSREVCTAILPFQTLEQISYRDTWGRGADSFIAMISERLILMRDWFKTGSSIYSKIYSLSGING